MECDLPVVLPVANDIEVVLLMWKFQTRGILETFQIANSLDSHVLQSAVRKHQFPQHYASQSARASAFFQHMNGKDGRASGEWDSRNVFSDRSEPEMTKQVYLLVLPMFNTPKVETNSANQIHSFPQRNCKHIGVWRTTLLMEWYWSQRWCGVTCVLCSKFVTLVYQEMIIGYHGHHQTNQRIRHWRCKTRTLIWR